MQDAERTAEQYDAISTAYRNHNEDSAANAYYERPATISLIGSVAGLRVLEAGCGPGALTEWLAAHGASVTAIDISPEMARQARARTGNRAQIIVADLAEPLTFAADESQDLVVASLALHYVADWASVLTEFHRVLTPSGAAVFSTRHPAIDWQLHSRENYFATKRVTETWDMPDGKYPVTFWRQPLTAMTAAISGAGFVIDQLVEPEPVPELAQHNPGEDHRLRTSPSFLFFRLTKRRPGPAPRRPQAGAASS